MAAIGSEAVSGKQGTSPPRSGDNFQSLSLAELRTRLQAPTDGLSQTKPNADFIDTASMNFRKKELIPY